ncbi:MAG: molybdenum cofactor biosynthesis protein MoaE [Xanthomonadales bacterium]|nr:molybdenum cofactor biosynthesis protein MoaE [Xanthomonadales bacterium]
MNDHASPSEQTAPSGIRVGVCDAGTSLPSVERALDFVSDPGFGGIAVFVGKIRNANVGREVTGIAYDMFAPLAGNLFRGFAEEVAAEFGPRVKLFVEHAKGQLGIGDIAVVVAAGTPHRDEAFRACRALIEAVKHRAPIWKQEHYVDGSSEWSEGCSLCDTSRAAEAAEAHAHDHAHDHAHEPGHRHV